MPLRRGPANPSCTESRTFLALLGLCVVLGPELGRAQDSDQPRYYLGLRASDTDPVTDVHDLWGVSFGYNFNRYAGVELAVDTFERDLEPPNSPVLGEYSYLPIMPQLRLRYPMLKDRLVPYFIGGAGVAFTQFNDRKPHGFGKSIDTESSAFVGAVGGGAEYFIADNIAIGLELRYLISESQSYRVDGVSHDLDPTSWLGVLSVRAFFPETHPRPLLAAQDPEPSPFYLGVRFGGALPAPQDIDGGVELQAEPSSIFHAFNQCYGVMAGVNLTPNLGAELSFAAFESRLNVEGYGAIGEYASYPILAQVRARFPIGEGRWTPYVLAGAGVLYGEFNDRLPAGEGIEVHADGFAPAAGVGGGMEFFLASNISLNLQADYYYAFERTMEIEDRPTYETNIGAFALTLGMRLYLFQFNRGD